MGCELPFLPLSISLHISVFPPVRLSALKGQCTLQENTHNHLLRFYRRPPPPPPPPPQNMINSSPGSGPSYFFLVKGLEAKTLQHLMHSNHAALVIMCWWNQLTTPCKIRCLCILTLLQGFAESLQQDSSIPPTSLKAVLLWSRLLFSTLLLLPNKERSWASSLQRFCKTLYNHRQANSSTSGQYCIF